jgi:hypothetical protein
MEASQQTNSNNSNNSNNTSNNTNINQQGSAASAKAIEIQLAKYQVPDTVTENGAPAFTTTGDKCLDLFAACVRGTPEGRVIELTDAAWNESPKHTLAISLHNRDCRKNGGKGEKLTTYLQLLWYRVIHPLTYLLNLQVFVEHGYFKDLFILVEMACQRGLQMLGATTWIELEVFAEFLRNDIAALDNAAGNRVPLTLAGKWAPTEKTHYDKKRNGNQAWVLAHLLFPGKKNSEAMMLYRRAISRLRENLKVVERYMAAGQWDKIDFATLPSKAHRLLRKAFTKHVPEQYQQYLDSLKKGEVKINSTGTQPHELVEVYLNEHSVLDGTIEGQWTNILKTLAELGTLDYAIAISDVSGSMSGLPMTVAIALGLVVSLLNSSPFKRKLITFSANPELHTVTGDTLYDMVNSVKNMSWGCNTDLLAVFQLLLNFAGMHQVSAENMPNTLFVFTDMQFDKAEKSDWKTTYQTILDMYTAAGYKVPNIVFWNLRDTKASFPTRADTPGVSLVSGFSADLLKVFMDGDLADMTPLKVMLATIAPYLEKVNVHPAENQKQKL